MGKNSRARRATKQRHRARDQGRRRTERDGTAPPRDPGGRGGGSGGVFGQRPNGSETFASDDDQAALAARHVRATVNWLRVTTSAREVTDAAALLQQMVPPQRLASAVDTLMIRMLTLLWQGGWGPGDLAEASVRVLRIRDHAVLAGHLARIGVGSSFRDELARLGSGRALDVRDRADLVIALRLSALFNALPAGTPSVRRAAPSSAAVPVEGKAGAKLAQVRVLLAKAEATDYAEEAEALSAKAQELMSRYSLEDLLERHDAAEAERDDIVYRRLWLDAPYVDAKSVLVAEIAAANRCQAVLASQVGLCTVVGSAFDIDAVELLVTSLLAQAQRAMLAHGSQRNAWGESRTRSFRRSFLMSFAIHIGERLRATAEASKNDVKDNGTLLPAIRDREEEVRHATEQLFPHVVSKPSSVTNADGWAGGRAAADQADLGARRRLG